MFDTKFGISVYDLLNQICLNNADEQDAISGYTNLWKMAEQLLDKRLIDENLYGEVYSVVKTALEEEMKHAKLLSALYSKISDIEAEE